LNVKANGEIISTIALSGGATVFAPLKNVQRCKIRCHTDLFGAIYLEQQTITIAIRKARRTLLAHQNIRSAISLTAIRLLLGFVNPRCAPDHAASQPGATTSMNSITSKSKIRARFRRLDAMLFGAAVGLSITASALAADIVTLRVGDQKGGNRSLLEIAGLAKDLPYRIEWSEFPAAAPILEALNAGALDVGYTGDLAFLTVYAAGAPIKAIGGTRADARTQAILVREDSPIRTAADLRGKRLAGSRGGWGQFLIDATLEKAGYKIDDATFAPLGPVDAKIALVAGSIDGWAVWEPYVSYATLKDHARIIADGEGLTPTVTFLVASDQAIATKRAAVQDLVQRLNKARLWSLDHLSEYAKSTAELTKLPEDVLLSAYTAQRTSPIVIDGSIVRKVQEASDRATRYGILSKTLDVNKAVDRSFTAASAESN
jgi:sulfonate transport system substrate-binding protein